MRLPTVLAALLVLCAVLCVVLPAGAGPAGAATAWPHVTVVARDGARHADVSLAWALDGYLLELTGRDGAVTTLAPMQVGTVLAADGRDITEEVGRACPATDVDFRLLGAGTRRPFSFTTMADVGGGGVLSNADGAGGPDAVLQAGLRVRAGRSLHVRLGLRRLSLSEGVGATGDVFSATSTDLLLMVGGRLKHPRENDNYSYLEAGVALVHLSDRLGGEDGTESPGGRTESAFAAQGGVVLPLDRTWGLDLGAGLTARPSLRQDGDLRLELGLNVALTLRDHKETP